MRSELKFLTLDYRHDLDILFCRWTNLSRPENIREGYNYLLEKLEAEGLHYYLFDLRQRGSAGVQDEQWIMESFFPKLEAYKSGINYFAYLVSPAHYKHVQQHIGFEKLERLTENTRICIFDSESKALQWLKACQQVGQEQAS